MVRRPSPTGTVIVSGHGAKIVGKILRRNLLSELANQRADARYDVIIRVALMVQCAAPAAILHGPRSRKADLDFERFQIVDAYHLRGLADRGRMRPDAAEHPEPEQQLLHLFGEDEARSAATRDR